MARIFIDGFESGKTSLWDVNNGSILAAKSGMSGTYCLKLNHTQISWRSLSSASSYYFACKIQYSAAYGATFISFKFNDDTQILLGLSSSNLQIKRGSTVLATGTTTLQVNTTYLIEIYFSIANAGGRFVVKLNGLTEIDFTGDTQELGGDQVNKLYLESMHNANTFYDDIVVDDSDWISDTKIEALIPTGAGTTTQWLPSAGANWETVDEIPASDADYNSVNAVDQIDTFATGDMAGDVGSVKCLQVQARASKDGTPTPLNFDLAVRSGGTDYFSADHEVPTEFADFSKLWEKNPNGDVAWTETSVNAMEIGYKSKT